MENFNTIRQQLLKRRKELNERVHQAANDARHTEEPLTPDFSEQAVERQHDEVLGALSEAGRRELVLINKALARIEAGDYGICAECGAEIPKARLSILPFSVLCVSCAEKQGV